MYHQNVKQSDSSSGPLKMSLQWGWGGISGLGWGGGRAYAQACKDLLGACAWVESQTKNKK